MIHLDTSFLIRSLVPQTREDAQLRQWLADGQALNVSSVVWTEFFCGPLGANDEASAIVLFPAPEPFVAEDGRLAAQLFNQSGRRRGTIMDCMIAASAIRVGVELATSNAADFRKFVPLGLRLIEFG